jgi:hypothetical protein
MSKRRNAGDIVKKIAGAGFVGVASLVKIVPEDDDDWSPCLLDCGDVECREWNTVHECDAAGTLLGGVACHVSECQMDDA